MTCVQAASSAAASRVSPVRPFMVTEGTNEIQKLAIGRSLTGIDTF